MLFLLYPQFGCAEGVVVGGAEQRWTFPLQVSGLRHRGCGLSRPAVILWGS